MSRRVYVDPNRRDATPREFSQNADSGLQYKIDFSGFETKRSTTVSGVTWSSEGSALITFTSESAPSSGVVTAYLTGTRRGRGLVKATASFADGSPDVVQWLKIHIEEPDRE